MDIKKELKEFGGIQLHITIPSQGLWTNCGANIIANVYARAHELKASSPEWGPLEIAQEQITKKMVYETLDSVDLIKSGMWSKGFILLTDRICEGTEVAYKAFRTRDFVKYLIDRKIGAVFRGPTTVNRGYPNNSAITSWIWAPHENLIDSRTRRYNVPESTKEYWGYKEKLFRPATVPPIQDVVVDLWAKVRTFFKNEAAPPDES